LENHSLTQVHKVTKYTHTTIPCTLLVSIESKTAEIHSDVNVTLHKPPQKFQGTLTTNGVKPLESQEKLNNSYYITNSSFEKPMQGKALINATFNSVPIYFHLVETGATIQKITP
jgi:hypothetical protein